MLHAKELLLFRSKTEQVVVAAEPMEVELLLLLLMLKIVVIVVEETPTVAADAKATRQGAEQHRHTTHDGRPQRQGGLRG